MNSNPLILIQGPITLEQIRLQKQCWNGYTLLFSTWEGTPQNWFEDSDNFILSPIPEEKGPSNFNLQKTSTIKGCQWAIERGYERIVKWRCDQFPINALRILERFDWKELNLLGIVRHHDLEYVCDFFVGGTPHEVINFFEVPIEDEIPEILLTKNCKQRIKTHPHLLSNIIWQSRHGWGTINLKDYRPGGGTINS